MGQVITSVPSPKRVAGKVFEGALFSQCQTGQQVMVQEIEVVEVDIYGRTFWVRPVGSWGPF